MFSYSPLIVASIAFGLLGPTATAEPFRLFRSSNLFEESRSDTSISNDDPDHDVSNSAFFKNVRQNGLIYAKKTREMILDNFFPEDLSMPSAGPTTSSLSPSGGPTVVDSVEPTRTESTVAPSVSLVPSVAESADPSSAASLSSEPTVESSTAPTQVVSENPSVAPSQVASENPSTMQTEVASENPSAAPTQVASENPSAPPSESPSGNPSNLPSKSASENPTIASLENSTETFFPSFSPSFNPTDFNVTDDDFVEDSSTETLLPSSNLTLGPSSAPTLEDCLITEEERAAQIFMLLDQAGNSTAIRDLDTPQGLAADWLIHQDFRKECPSEKIVQRWVMAVFYFATTGDFWGQCSAAGSDPCGSEFPFEGARRFLSDFSECEWAGITCDIDDCVTEIEFEENFLVGTIPTELGLLKELVVLGMERGGLSSTIPSEIGLLTKLIFIDLDFNELTGSLPEELFLLTNLETLDLNDNLLEGNIDFIGFLENLQFLQLQTNQFTGTVPEDVGNLTMITTFNLHENLFSGTMPEAVCDLRESNGGFLQSLIADCGNSSGLGPAIECDCCSSCRG